MSEIISVGLSRRGTVTRQSLRSAGSDDRVEAGRLTGNVSDVTV